MYSIMITQEDLKRIQTYLLYSAIKDTQFEDAKLPLKGNEVLAIVQDNKNVKITLSDLGSVSDSGSTDQRPDNPIIGTQYFDTTLQKLIVFNGEIWMDTMGNPADAPNIGTTDDRPQDVQVGFIFYDIEEEHFVIWNGQDWVPVCCGGGSILMVTPSSLDYPDKGDTKEATIKTNDKWNIT